MIRCEDYPCCGCGPEGCVDFSRVNKCEECGESFHPDDLHERYCLRCAHKPSRPRWKELTRKENCKSCAEYGNPGDPPTPAVADYAGYGPVCEDCADDIEQGYADARDYGDY